MSGNLKTFIDRFAGALDAPYLLIQGTEPDDTIPFIPNVRCHFCRRFHTNYMGLANNSKGATKLHKLMVNIKEKG